MKQSLLILIIVIGSFLNGCQCTTIQNNEMQEMVKRLVPAMSNKLIFETIQSERGNVFELEQNKKGKIIIRGNNNLAKVVGLNHYLKYYYKTSVSWYANDAISLPDDLPPVPEKVRKQARIDKLFFLNYCTFGYTLKPC